jgi:hypothetical protein
MRGKMGDPIIMLSGPVRRLRRHARAWACHAALNAGEAVVRARQLAAAVAHAVLPPQFDHAPESVEWLSTASPWRCFRDGLK